MWNPRNWRSIRQYGTLSTIIPFRFTYLGFHIVDGYFQNKVNFLKFFCLIYSYICLMDPPQCPVHTPYNMMMVSIWWRSSVMEGYLEVNNLPS